MAERPPLAAVLFDAGGTLVRLDFEWIADALAGLGLEIPAGRLRTAEVAGRRRYDANSAPPEHGQPTPIGPSRDPDAYFAGMLEAAGVPGRLLRPALEGMHARQAGQGLWDRPAEGARAALDAVAALGLRLAAVSNSDGRAEETLARHGVRVGLEFVIDSHLVGIEKPDPRIFALALRRMDVPAERALYVGDIVSVDVRGARAAGMQVVLIDAAGDYAPPGVATIPRIDALPAWIATRFTVVPTRAGARLPGARGGASPS